MHEEIKAQIAQTFMRGFRAAVSGEIHAHYPVSAFGHGFAQGRAAVEIATNTAKRYAEHVVDSPAMAQAKANAESGVK